MTYFSKVILSILPLLFTQVQKQGEQEARWTREWENTLTNLLPSPHSCLFSSYLLLLLLLVTAVDWGLTVGTHKPLLGCKIRKGHNPESFT